MRELLVQEKIFGDTSGRHLRRVHFAIRLKRSTTLEESNPFEMFGEDGILLRLFLAGRKMDVDQRRCRRRAFNKPAKLNELPSFAVAHGGIGHTLKQVRLFADGVEELEGLRFPESG